MKTESIRVRLTEKERNELDNLAKKCDCHARNWCVGFLLWVFTKRKRFNS